MGRTFYYVLPYRQGVWGCVTTAGNAPLACGYENQTLWVSTHQGISLNHVSALPAGIYYLLIDSGNGNKPETHKIIVKH